MTPKIRVCYAKRQMKEDVPVLQVKEIETSTLKPWDDNPRVNDGAVDAVARRIEAFGFNVPILCDQNSTIVAGHTRWKAATKLGMKTVPVIAIKLTDTQRGRSPWLTTR